MWIINMNIIWLRVCKWILINWIWQVNFHFQENMLNIKLLIKETECHWLD
jgi:hypothetical protein